MKKYLLFVSFMAFFFPTNVCAGESVDIALAQPANIAKEACPSPIWKDVPAVWNGVKDKRAEPQVGLQTQKDKEPISVLANPPLEEVFDSALKNLLSACGMKFVAKDTENALSLSAEIKEFYAGVEKKLVTGKGTAKSLISFTANKGGLSSNVTVGYELESKKLRSGNIKQLTSTLNELLAGILKQIPATDEMRELK